MFFLGLYRDDRSGVLRDLSGHETERLPKNVVKIFKNCGLRLTNETNQKIIDYLGVTFYLWNNSCKFYRKPNGLPVYIDYTENNPPTILNKLPKSIGKRISDLYSREKFSTMLYLYIRKPYEKVILLLTWFVHLNNLITKI